MNTSRLQKTVSTSTWTVALFYILIGFEFLYMASPFAVYFYSVYGPGLRWLNNIPAFAFLANFFMPHIVRETSSWLLNLHNVIGIVLASVGGAAFCIGAGQVYYGKLRKRGAITGGVYRIIRHPQYASLLLCGFGLLLLWPRYLALLMFITVGFIYYGLARLEERECEEKFGESYLEYERHTNMFFPLPRWLPHMKMNWRMPRTASVLLFVVAYAAALAAGIGLARHIQVFSIRSLYALSVPGGTYVSVCRTDRAILEQVAAIVARDERVAARLSTSGAGSFHLAYVLPESWYVPEIPMYIPQGLGHESPRNYDPSLYKTVYTNVTSRAASASQQEFLSRISGRTALFEATINLREGRVVQVRDATKEMRYNNIPVAIY